VAVAGYFWYERYANTGEYSLPERPIPPSDTVSNETLSVPPENNKEIVLVEPAPKQPETFSVQSSNDALIIDTVTAEIKPESEPVTLEEEIAEFYKEMTENSLTSESIKLRIKELENKINNLPDEERARLVFNSVLGEDILEIFDLNLNPISVIPLQGFRRPILVNRDDVNKPPTNELRKQSTEIGIAFTHTDNDIIDSYFYDDKGQFTGVVRFVKGVDSQRFLHEQVRGVNTRLFAGTVYHMINDLQTPATFYVMGRSLNSAQVRLEEINNSTPLAKMVFPVSSSTLVSVRIEMIDGVLNIGKWNFDFDGDDKTDLTLGNAEAFTEEHIKLALQKMSNDLNLSQSDRDQILAALVSANF